jgi:hypothetical protein
VSSTIILSKIQYNESNGTHTNGNNNQNDNQDDDGSGDQAAMIEVVVDSFDTTTGVTWILVNDGVSEEAIAQSLTGTDITITKSVFSIERFGNPTGDLYAKLYAHSGTFGTSSVPTGAALATSDPVSYLAVPTVDPADITFTFSGANRYKLVAGTKYVVVLDVGGTFGNGSNYFLTRGDITSPTHSGNSAGYISSWTAASGSDFVFALYGTEQPILTTSAATAVGSTKATLNGSIDAVGSGDADIRGFVYSPNSIASTPGNVAPASTGYTFSSSSSGTFSTGSYTSSVTTLSPSTTYYARAYAHNADGYAYGEEVSFSTSNLTTVSFSGVDPTDIFKQVIDDYVARGGVVNYDGSSTDDTGLSLSYTFNTATILEGVRVAHDLAPSGWYWYVDLGTSIAYFKNTPTTPTHKLINGRHIGNLKLVMSTENVKNIVYFTGGETAGTNLFKEYRDSASISSFGQRIERKTDNRVTLNSTADAIGESIIVSQRGEAYHTVVDVLDTTYDITLFKPGDTVGLLGYGNFVEDLLLQIVRIEYTPTKARLLLGTLPPRLSGTVEQVRRDLISVQTVLNPSEPA